MWASQFSPRVVRGGRRSQHLGPLIMQIGPARSFYVRAIADRTKMDRAGPHITSNNLPLSIFQILLLGERFMKCSVRVGRSYTMAW